MTPPTNHDSQSPAPGGDCDPDFSAGHPARPAAAAAASGHSHSHSHSHTHGPDADLAPAAGADLQGAATATGKHRKRLIWVLSITLGVFVVQLIGAFISNSLSLLADAGHMLTDATGVAIALIASLIAALPATSKRTFGYLRVEVLAALANGIVLGVIAVVILVQAISRFGSEVEVHSTPMLIAAIIGAVANLISLLVLQSAQKESLNVRGAYLEVLGDLLGSIAVIVAGLIIMYTGWNMVDQIASILIALLIFPRAVSLLREVVNVLLEASPKNLDVEVARKHMLAVPGVAEVHDLHAWTITSGVPAFSAHVTVTDDAWDERGYHAILDELKACLMTHFDVDHSTIQLEPASHHIATKNPHA
ncbi:cobalt-zinc-cadmium efflux system protein [Leucobacter exalbidus]|uniref:Cobalt-zinc-cadmium efflux system protein n=1 Tax=Leucobacter exalbidus TaxID=662960 RepID=A0A940T470_9MICO|nr:cation diffusion facilitator family transporter [Leucobacter exalbidus]MBP1326519.1 cobalt-zinc-cadmium efflux system protein [Leucobacter exalbidus]